MRFNESVVLIAGGTGGLGRAVSLAFLQEEAKVVVTYRNEEELASLRNAAASAAASLSGEQVDVTQETEVGQLIAGIVAKYGRLDALVNAVGAYSGGTKLWEAGSRVFDQMVNLNVRAGLVLTRAVIPAMLKKGRGAIVNVASKAAIEHAAGNAAYSASKAAALAMIDSVAEEVRGSGLRVNSVLPSIIDTAANRKAMPNADFSTWPKPDEIARVILFLCSDDAKVIHGAAVPVYGAS